MSSSMQPVDLQLVPLIMNGSTLGKPLPLNLGRVELVTWWLTSCCHHRRSSKNGRGRRTRCKYCKSVCENAKFLSKSMLMITKNYMLVNGKNCGCIFLNGTAAADVAKRSSSSGIPVCDGDVLSFQGKSSAVPWMKFQFRSIKSSNVVTPDKQIRDSQDSGDDEGASFGEAPALNTQGCSSMGGAVGSSQESICSGLDTQVGAEGVFSVSKRKRIINDTPSEQPKSKRKLFPSPISHRNDEFASLSQQRNEDPVTSSHETIKRGTQAPPAQDCLCSPPFKDSLLSLPRFSLTDEDEESPQVAENSISEESTNTKSKPQSRYGYESSLDMIHVSELSRTQWRACQCKSMPRSSVGRALVNLVLANEDVHEGMLWLPALLNGAMVSKSELK